MIRLIISFIVLIGAVYLGTQLRHDPGYILLSLNHWTVETTVWVALILLMLGFFLCHWLLIVVGKILHLSSSYENWRKKHRKQVAHEQTRKALIEFSEGHWMAAKKHLIKALPDTDTPLLNYLTAARAAQEMGDSQLRDDYLREAQQSMPEAKIAVELTQAQLQLADQQWEQALATLKHLQDLAPKHPYVLKLLMHLYQEVKDWQQLIDLLPKLKKYGILNNTEYDAFQHRIYLRAIEDLIRQQQTDKLNEMMSNLPKPLRQDNDLLAAYCEFLINTNKKEQAEAVLRRGLRKHYNAKLITLYGKIHISESQLEFAESLLNKQTNSPELYTCLGQLSLINQMWGKAKNYFEQSLAIKVTPEAYAGLGQLHEALHNETNACKAYRRGLELVV